MKIKAVLRISILLLIILAIIFVPYYTIIISQMINPNVIKPNSSILYMWGTGLTFDLIGIFIIFLGICACKILWEIILSEEVDNFINWLLDKPKNKSNSVTIKSK